MHLHFDGEAAGALVGFIEEIGKRLRVALGTRKGRTAERRERFQRDDPRRYRRGEALREERPQRLVFPRLDVARRPVVEEYDAEDVLEGILDRDRPTQPAAGADDEAELGFVIEALAWPEYRDLARLDLAARARDGSAGHHDRRSAAVVADRHPLVVRQQRIVRAEQLADVGRVVNAGVEVAVVADRDRQLHV